MVLLKQPLSMKCFCGVVMEFPEGEIKARCQSKGCSAYWELGLEGFWSATLAPIIAKPKERKLNHYERYMKWRNENRRKAGSRCSKR